MNRPQKVVAYIVHEGRLLVFVHADDERFDESGVQVPAGTVRDGELPEHAVLREAAEETGLGGLRIHRYLGAGEYDMRPIRFELYGLPLARAHAVAAGQAAFLGRTLD